MPRRPKDGWSTLLKATRCSLFESEVRERNESNWISIEICNWKKALAKIKSHYKSAQHKSSESARARFLQRDKHIDVMLDSSREEELTRKQREIEMNRCYLVRLVDVAKTLAKCRDHKQKKEIIDSFASMGPRRMQLT